MICPNLNDPEVKAKFDQLLSVVPEYAYYLWDKYEGEVPAKYYNLPKSAVKEGVEELFVSNPELANQVYESLGFKTKTSENEITRAIKEELPYKVIGNYNEIDEGLIGRKVYEETIDNNVYKFEISNYKYENEDGTYQSYYDIDFTVNDSEELVGSGFFNKAEKAKQIIQA
jgi:hypothetical protein